MEKTQKAKALMHGTCEYPFSPSCYYTAGKNTKSNVETAYLSPHTAT